MKSEIDTFISTLENIMSGDPWFGRPFYEILEEVNAKKAFISPKDREHSLIDLLYHIITWTKFTLNRIENDTAKDLTAIEEQDWRIIDPGVHTWKKSVAEFKATNKKIIALLQKKDDKFLDEKVDYRTYNFRYLLNGLIQHHIYHLGQIAYLKKMLD